MDPGLPGTSPRDDGDPNVTYDGYPLYHFQGDTEAGDTNGQGVDGFGALRWVRDAEGDAIEKTSPPDPGGY